MKSIVLAAVLAASLSAAPALAQTDARTRIVISPAGLDLATAEGRAALDLRVLHAARAACGTPSPADAQGRGKTETCVADLRLAAAAQTEVMIAAAGRRARPALASR